VTHRAIAASLAVASALTAWGWLSPAEQRPHFIDAGDRVYSRVDGPLPCDVSYDGDLWYEVGPGRFVPVVARSQRCPPGSSLHADLDPPIPMWSKPRGPTQTLFAFVSFHEIVSRAGMQRLAELAHRHGIPVTWLTGQPLTFDAAGDLYDDYHARFGDDLQIRPTNHNPHAPASLTPTGFAKAAARRFSWFRPVVAAEGSGYDRGIAQDIADGYQAFWGIAWNSHGLDNDYDEGTPWGAYCADPSSYRRPAARRVAARKRAACRLVGFEWTARDLTRAAISDHEEFYSTDPDDLQAAGFDATSGPPYMEALVDAYAAAGESAPLLMIVQQEPDQMDHPPLASQLATSTALLEAMLGEVRRDGMRAVTLRDAVDEARRFARARRVVAFPYIPSLAVPEAWAPWSYRGPYPATIDYTDSSVAMSFVEGRMTPVRVFRFDRARNWPTALPLPRLQRSEMPALVSTEFRGSILTLRFDAPVPTRYGIALWSDPAKARWTSRRAGIANAGRAGTVAWFDLSRGRTEIELRCSGCARDRLPMAP
jgi:hypothetical protein